MTTELTIGIILCIVGIASTWTSGLLAGDREELGSFVVGFIAAVFLSLGVIMIIPNIDKNTAGQETINSPQFRAGAVYEKLSEIKIGEYYLAILKDSKENIAVYKSPKKLPDKFIASELNDVVPIGGLVELGVESKKEEQKTEDDKVEAEKEK